MLKINILGFEIIEDKNDGVIIKVGAGENWDDVVLQSVTRGFSGLEALSAIPGTVGAAPVQNIGAYGSEIKNTLVSVECFNLQSGKFENLSNADCQFAYRSSIFNGKEKGKYIITSVSLKLSKNLPKIPEYADVKKYFIDLEIENPTLLQIRDAIVGIRLSKLPDPVKSPNVGSFFKNPILEKGSEAALRAASLGFPLFETEKGLKISAGFLIEKAGLKGKSFGNISVYDKNALVLTNNGKATFAELQSAKDEIIETVKKQFGIKLQPEPNFI